MAVKELPEELIAFILSKLPVKSLLRFKCVRKSWYSLIKSPSFIDLHLKNRSSSTNSNNDCVIVRRCFQQQHPLKRHVLSFYSYETLADLGIEINTPFSKQTEVVSVSGPCNGLICITNNNDQIVISNPSMREFRSLFVPPSFGYRSGYHYDTVALGFDPNSCEYKVVMIGVYYDNSDHYNPEDEPFYAYYPGLYRGDREAKVYDFSTDSWRDTGVVIPYGFHYSPVAISLNGAFHWSPLIGGDSILSFLISDELTKTIPLPEFYSWQEEGRFRDLYVLNKSLALIVHGPGWFEISVMTEYGVKESWNKLFLLGPLWEYSVPLAFWNDQLFLEATYSNGDDPPLPGSSTTQLVSCDLQHQNITHFQIYGLHPLVVRELVSLRSKASFDVFLYSESLVSVNGIGGEYCLRDVTSS